MARVTVLMYHALEDAEHPAGARDIGEQVYVLPVETFRAQLKVIRDQGARVLALEDLERPACWSERPVLITFDDGHASNLTLALPILEEFGFPAHFFVTTGWLDTPNYLSAAQLQELAAAGMGIGSHGVTHEFFDDMTEDQVAFELRESQQVLARLLGRPVTGFSAPGGRVGRRLAAAAQLAGYRYLCTSRTGLFARGDALLSIRRVAIRNDLDLAVFSGLIRGDNGTLRRWRLREMVLTLGKKLLGNARYLALRERLLAASQRTEPS